MSFDILAASAWATTLALPVAAAALIYAGYQTRLSRLASAASVMLAMSEAFRDAWAAFAVAEDGTRKAAFADLLNLLEAGCSVWADGLLVGRSGRLLETYLINTLTQIEGSAPARLLFEELVETDRTFEEIGRFLVKKRRHRRAFLARLKAHKSLPASN